MNQSSFCQLAESNNRFSRIIKANSSIVEPAKATENIFVKIPDIEIVRQPKVNISQNSIDPKIREISELSDKLYEIRKSKIMNIQKDIESEKTKKEIISKAQENIQKVDSGKIINQIIPNKNEKQLQQFS